MTPNKGRGVPVVMYHSVVPREQLWSRISDPLDEFEKVLCNLTEAGFQTILLDDLHAHLKDNKPLPDKSIALTFDDGYLDNWLHVFPLLKKYGQKATLFPSLEFIGEGKARTLCSDDVLEYDVGYLNWSEMKIMQASGHVDIQSHTMTHTWKFSSPEVTDFLVPNAAFNWLEWNRNRSIKPLWKPNRILPGLITGYPLFKYGRALGVREFIPDEDFVTKITDTVSENGGIEFLGSEQSKRGLQEIVDNFSHDRRGRFETDFEFQRRVDYELGDSREILSDRLGKPIKFLCWPGGGWHPFVGEKWKQYGYLATSLPSGRTNRQTNLPGDNPTSFARISSGLGEWRLRGRTVGRLNSRYFSYTLDQYLGVPGALTRMRLSKLSMLSGKILAGSRSSNADG